ncbi:nucleolar pre-ribosomal-associated protein 1 [Diachasma alloeum]|uniref:nucleolar pre-ribosomal-associated protein 1 n=1 Tax=Diachasma alloeum TaxID=454923 RepID=UPI000738340F|nr:nucleolar pre-ribosomal-associated protein 1 [Diachasma alloeum]
MRIKMNPKTAHKSSLLESEMDNYLNNGNFEYGKEKLKRKNGETNSEVINNTLDNLETPIKRKKKKMKSKSNGDTSRVPNESIFPATLTVEKKKKKKVNEMSGAAIPPTDNNSPNEPEPIRKHSENDGKLSEEQETLASNLSSKRVMGISANYLRSSLKTASGLGMLRKFVTICTENTERDLASEYIEKSGHVFEILQLLEECDKDLNKAALVFSGMHIVIMKILEKYPQQIAAAQEACHHLINVHLSTVHAMMSNQSNPKQRKIVLRLLASIVSLGDTLPRELLAHLSFHQETLTLMSKQTKPTDPQSVRTCFIHFILSFLVNARASVIRALLDKRGLLTSIFPELIYDSHSTVLLVLNTIKTYVLENNIVSKTLKLQVFSTPVVHNLVSLYNWKGPSNWPGFENNKRNGFTECVDLEEKAITIEAVHDFLIVLLTSNRHGIIFNDKTLGTTRKKHNQLVSTILQSLEHPWEHEKPGDLVSKILVACPDLIKPQLAYIEPFLVPRPSKKWIAVMDFVKRVLSAVALEKFLKYSLSELTSQQLITATLTLTMPLIVLKNAVIPSLNSSSIILCYEAVTTLTVMLNQVRKFLEVAERHVSVSEYSNLHSHVIDYASKKIPSVEDVLRAWKHADKPSESLEAVNLEEIQFTPPKSKYFSSVLDLIQNYHQVLPECMRSKSLSDLTEDSQLLLTSINDLRDVNEEELNSMKLKAIQIIQVFNPKIFKTDEEFLGNILLFLISLLENPSGNLKSKGIETTKVLLNELNIFKNCEDQMNIWLNSLKLLKNSRERAEVAQWLVKIISKAVKRPAKYQKIIEEVEKAEEFLTSEDDMNKLMQPTTNIPLILCACYESLKEKWNETAGRFVGFITILTLHCQVSPNALIYLSEGIQGEQVEYLKSWKEGETPIPLKKMLSTSIVGKFSKILLASDEITFDRILNDKDGLHSNYEILHLLKMTVFYLTQCIQRRKLTQEQFNRYKYVIIALLDFYKKTDWTSCDSNYVLECSRHILTHPTILHSFNPIPKTKFPTERIVTTGLVEIFDKIIDVNYKSNVPDLFLSFKNKLMSHLEAVLRKCAGGWTLKTTHCLVKFIEILQLTSFDLLTLFKSLTSLPKASFLSEDKKVLSIWGEMVPKLLELLSERQKLEILMEFPEETQLVHKLFIYFTHLKYTGINLESWENSLHKFLKAFPHYIAIVDPKTFNSLLENEFDESTIPLISFLTARNPKLIPLFTKYISTEKSRIRCCELIFSVLSSNLSYKWNSEFLFKICKQYEQNIINYFLFYEETLDWINQNVDSVAYLIDSCFSLEICERITTKVLSSGDKLETVDFNYAKLLQHIFTRLSQLHRNPQEILCQGLQVFIRLIVSYLKKNAKDSNEIEILCIYMFQTITRLKSINKDFIFEDLSKSYSWSQFTRFSLRSGLKNSKNDSTKNHSLLKTLSQVCDIAYKDKSETEYVKTLFEMTTSHSEFVNLMLSSQNIKKDLLQLIFVLIKKNPTIMKLSHIPLYLSAYNATLNEFDQQILLILQYYERSGIKLTEYQPYLYGEAAASYYSLRGRADTVIWRQPSVSQVLQLFNIDIVKNTITNFPVRRTLHQDELYDSESVYDPAFYLPLLTHLLAGNNVIACHNVTRSGALALLFAACGSVCQEIRMATLTVISRFYFHLEATRSKEKLLWMRMIDALRNGIASLESFTEIRLNCFISTFLARSALVATEPLNPLYAPLQNFFMAKPELDLRTIPEFLTLFNSSDINHKVQRHWILEVIRDGLKTDLEMQISSKCFLFRTLFYVHGSILADPSTKILILQIINSAVKISKAGIFCRNSGLLVWLSEVADGLNVRDIEGIELIVNIVKNLPDTLLNCNDKDSHMQFMLLDVLKTLIPKLSITMKMSSYSKLLRSLRDILQNKLLCEMIHKNQIQHLIEVSKNIIGDVEECTEILGHECEFITKKEVTECNNEVCSAKVNLRNIVITWRNQVANV